LSPVLAGAIGRRCASFESFPRVNHSWMIS
jgi:hypothetical protein